MTPHTGPEFPALPVQMPLQEAAAPPNPYIILHQDLAIVTDNWGEWIDVIDAILLNDWLFAGKPN